ncbi:MAG TPA: vWA domain-containing protein [Polyangiaceae bacterium]|nr:vWA domain-containing protein [Polyangiaceae bacterium]
MNSRVIKCAAFVGLGLGIYACDSGSSSVDEGCTSSSQCPGDQVCTAEGDCVSTSGTGGAAPGSGGSSGSGASGGSAGSEPGGMGGSAGGDATGGSPNAGGSSGSGATELPTVWLVLDASTSMENPATAEDDTSSRWDHVLEAFADNGPLPTYESRLRLGLMTYANDAALECPGGVTLSPAVDSAEEIAQAVQEITGTFPEKSDTPTAAAIAEAHAALGPVPGPRYIVLITDNQPDTCEMPDPSCGHDATFAELQAAHESGITTFVVGVGNDWDDSPEDFQRFLADAANAGGGQPVQEPSDGYLAECGATLSATYAESGGSASPYQVPGVTLGQALTSIFDEILE